MDRKLFKLSNGRPRLFTAEELDEAMNQWKVYGHNEATMHLQNGCLWVDIPFTKCKLQVRHGEIAFHGEWTDDAIAAAIRHAQEAWGGKLNVHGSEEFKMRVWAHCRIAGVEIGNYVPPAERMQEARSLVTGCSVANFNRSMGLADFGGPVDRRRWGYRIPEPTPEERRYMDAVDRAHGLYPGPQPAF